MSSTTSTSTTTLAAKNTYLKRSVLCCSFVVCAASPSTAFVVKQPQPQSQVKHNNDTYYSSPILPSCQTMRTRPMTGTWSTATANIVTGLHSHPMEKSALGSKLSRTAVKFKNLDDEDEDFIRTAADAVTATVPEKEASGAVKVHTKVDVDMMDLPRSFFIKNYDSGVSSTMLSIEMFIGRVAIVCAVLLLGTDVTMNISIVDQLTNISNMLFV